MDYGKGLRLQLGLSLLTRAPVARLRFAATGTDAAQLFGGLIKEDVRVFGHESSFGTTIHPVVGVQKQVEGGSL